MAIERKKIYAAAQEIPYGMVATYGQVARMAGYPNHARQVGYAMAALEDGSDVPWHRVINAKGMISIRSEGDCENYQQELLEQEGIIFKNDKVSLSKYRFLG